MFVVVLLSFCVFIFQVSLELQVYYFGSKVSKWGFRK